MAVLNLSTVDVNPETRVSEPRLRSCQAHIRSEAALVLASISSTLTRVYGGAHIKIPAVSRRVIVLIAYR